LIYIIILLTCRAWRLTLYFDSTLVGQEIIQGKHIREGGVSPEEYLHYIIACMCHDIGYVKGVCRADKPHKNQYATGVADKMVTLQEGSTDAALTPHHVDRGKLFVAERFADHKIIDAEKLKKYIELTRFPVPNNEDALDTKGFPALVRAADLIGQLADTRYLQKIAALYYEFYETGTAQKLGYKNQGDLKNNYPKFYWSGVFPYIKHALRNLQVTQEGKSYVAQLFANVFAVEHASQMELALTTPMPNSTPSRNDQQQKFE